MESRRGRDAVEHVPALLRERGVEVIDVVVASSRREVCRAVKRAVKKKTPIVAVCGGDGTQSAVIEYFVNVKSSVLGVIPAGTGNSFAMGLGLEPTFEAACDAIAFGQERAIDVGRVNDTYFANFITIGLAAQIGQDTPRGLKAVLGPIAYGVAAIKPLLTHEPFRADLRWKKHRLRLETHQIIVANGRLFGHQPLAPDASFDDGRLTVFVREASSRIDLMETYFALMRGDHTNLRGVHLFSTGSKLTIRTKKKAPVATDGDSAGKTPITVRVYPAAARVMVPREVTRSA